MPGIDPDLHVGRRGGAVDDGTEEEPFWAERERQRGNKVKRNEDRRCSFELILVGKKKFN